MKRLPVFVLIITAFILISGCSEMPGDPLTPKTAAFYPLGKEISVDLNGDGNNEKVFYSTDDFRINDVSYKDTIENVYWNNPLADNYLLTDIDSSNKQKEIALLTDGPSDDPEAFFYTFEDDKLIELGSVPSAFADLDTAFTGDGIIHGKLRLNVLQTWWAPAAWQLNPDSTITLCEQKLYYPLQYTDSAPVMLKVELPIYKNIGDAKNFAVLEPQEVTFPATDNKNWCAIKGKDGTKGWFRIEEFSWLPDIEMHAEQAFDNLCMAD